MRELSSRKMKNEEQRMKNRLLQILTSLSSLFSDKFLSGFFTSTPLSSFAVEPLFSTSFYFFILHSPYFVISLHSGTIVT